MIIYIAIYRNYFSVNMLCFFSLADAARQVEKWKFSFPSENSEQFSIKEEFVHGNNPFFNNQELID